MAYFISTQPDETTDVATRKTRTFTFDPTTEDFDTWRSANYNAPFPAGTNLYTKTVTGHVYDSSGVAVVGATVQLFRQYDDYMVATTTSGVQGIYLFPRRFDDTYLYYAFAYSVVGGIIHVHGTSDRGLLAEA